METDTLKFPNIERVLKEYADKVPSLYRSLLDSKGKNASHKLSDSIQAEVRHNGGNFQVVVKLEEYWKYVEYGRKPGKFPPPDKIREWVEIKPVIPRPMKNGKLPTIEQLTYLIGRKIAIKGIPPSPVLVTTTRTLNEEFFDKIYEAIRLDVANAVKTIIHTAF